MPLTLSQVMSISLAANVVSMRRQNASMARASHFCRRTLSLFPLTLEMILRQESRVVLQNTLKFRLVTPLLSF